MKKITFLVLAVLAFQFNYAQDTCATATVVTAGTTTVAAVDGTEIPNPECAANEGGTRTAGEWFTFTATVDGVANITTDIAANTGGDTRLHVYSGTCASLSCLGGNDDVDAGGGNYLSDFTFVVSIGNTYIFAWDDRWSAAGFDFVLTETAVTCPDGSFPISEDFSDPNQFVACYTVEDIDANGTAWIQQELDLDGTAPVETFATNGSNGANAKDDWLISPQLNLTANNDYDFNFNFNGADGANPANETLTVLLLDGPTSTANVVATLYTTSGIIQNGAFADLQTNATNGTGSYTPTMDETVYLAFNTTSPPNGGFLLVFDYSASETLSVNEFEANTFTKKYNKVNQTLLLESSNMAFTSIEVYSILGQQVISKPLANTAETIDVSGLNNGVYLAKVYINGNSKTIKFIKN